MPKKELKHICANCQLYDMENRYCKVVILFEGKRIHPPTEPESYCLFEDEYEAIDEKGNIDKWKPEIQEVKWWVEDPNSGEKSDSGVVKIEYPIGFFGKDKESLE